MIKGKETMAKEIPCYIFTGFLESGKTTFIQGTLEDERFNAGERTLLIVCEEGVEEYDPSRFSYNNVVIEMIDDQNLINPVKLANLVKESKAERVLIEYNGMWMLDDLFAAMPENWVVYQEFSFAETATYLNYNANMRTFTYDKLKSCDCIVFNRFADQVDKMELHKIVRAVSRRTDIVYERIGGEAEVDDIEDPLPFDKEAPVVKIEDRDYALFYRDLSEDLDGYDGKTVEFVALTGNAERLPKGVFVVGREIMTCCVEDIRMAGLACECQGEKPKGNLWVRINAEIKVKKSAAYGNKKGPVLILNTLMPANEPEEPVATFY